MIRPFTCVTVLLAAGTGLFLYQTKHHARLLDKQIADTIHATEAARASTGILRAEWQLLNDTERLNALAGRYLTLKPTAPTQFTTLADLASRLPPVRPMPAPGAKVPTDTDGPAPGGDGSSPPIAATEPTPAADAPARPTTVAAAAVRPDTHAADQHAQDQHAADQRAQEQHAQERRLAERRAATPAPADPYRPGALATRVVTRSAVTPVAAYSPPPRPIARPPAQEARAAAPMFSGSSLGMARASSLPAPIPIGGLLRSNNPADAPGGGG